MTNSAAREAIAPLGDLYRQMWRHAAGERLRLIGALSLLGASQLLRLALPWATAQAIDTIQLTGRAGLPRAGAWIAAILAFSIGAWLLHGPGRVIERSVAVRVRRSVADALYLRLAQAPLSWHDRHHSGDLQHRVMQASSALSQFTQSQFIYLQSGINLIGPLAALVLLSPWTGGAALLGYLAIALVVMRFDNALMRLAQQENTAERRYAARLLDFVGNVSSVISLRLQQATRRLLDRRLLAVFEPLNRSIVLNELKWCAVDLLTLGLSWGLVVSYAVGMAVAPAAAGGVLIGSLFMVYQYAQQAAGVLGSMAGNYQGLVRARTDFASAAPIWEAPERVGRGAVVGEGWRRIELQGLGFDRVPHAGAAAEEGARGGLEGIGLVLHRGERLALVGASGAGKSTLLRVLAGLYDAQRGQIVVDGLPQPGLRHLGESATLIPQEAEIFEASVRENIAFDLDANEQAIAEAAHASAFDSVLAHLPQGLETPIAERGSTLSGGQRQRLALARGLLAARGSSLLLLDEPTSALDPLTELRVHSRIEQAFAGACIVASVHRLGLLALFDRIVFMSAGRILDAGTLDELVQRQPLFAEMLDSMRGGSSDDTDGDDTDEVDEAAVDPVRLGDGVVG